jgi:hypothetical protein
MYIVGSNNDGTGTDSIRGRPDGNHRTGQNSGYRRRPRAGETALKNIITGVEAAGGTKSDIVTMPVFTTDARYHPDVNAVRREVFESDFPASTMVQVGALARPELLIEINATAIIAKQRRGSYR